MRDFMMRDIKPHNCDVIYRGPQSDESPHLSFINLDGSARVDYDLDLPIRKMMFLGIKSVRNAAAEGGLLGDQEMALVKAYIFSFAELIESFNKSE